MGQIFSCIRKTLLSERIPLLSSSGWNSALATLSRPHYEYENLIPIQYSQMQITTAINTVLLASALLKHKNSYPSFERWVKKEETHMGICSTLLKVGSSGQLIAVKLSGLMSASSGRPLHKNVGCLSCNLSGFRLATHQLMRRVTKHIHIHTHTRAYTKHEHTWRLVSHQQ